MSMTHPFDTDTTYELLDDGNVRLSCGDKAGIFTGEGIYVSGDIRSADPQVCNWVNNVPNPDTNCRFPESWEGMMPAIKWPHI